MILLWMLNLYFIGVLSLEDPGHDDFELWSPSEERSERCLFGRQVCFVVHALQYILNPALLDSLPSPSTRS